MLKKMAATLAAATLGTMIPAAANAATFFTLDIFAPPSNNTSLDKPRFVLTNTSTAGEAITSFTISYSGVTTIIDVLDSCGAINSPPPVGCGAVTPSSVTSSNGLGAQSASLAFTSFPVGGQAQFKIEFDEPGVNGSNSDFRDVLFNNNASATVAFGAQGSQTIQLGNPGAAAVYSYNSASVAAVPEPATWVMMLMGFGILGFGMRRRNVKTTVSYA